VARGPNSVSGMSYQAYLDTIEKKTGRTPQELLDQAAAQGFDASTKARVVCDWLKAEHDLGWQARDLDTGLRETVEALRR